MHFLEWKYIDLDYNFIEICPIGSVQLTIVPGDKPLSVQMRVRLPTQKCVTRPQWVLITCLQLSYCDESTIVRFFSFVLFVAFLRDREPTVWIIIRIRSTWHIPSRIPFLMPSRTNLSNEHFIRRRTTANQYNVNSLSRERSGPYFVAIRSNQYSWMFLFWLIFNKSQCRKCDDYITGKSHERHGVLNQW